jgi:GDPmannose 4,6-dehydratase
VREYIEKTFGCLGMTIGWKGKGVDEVGVDTKTGKKVITIDPKYFRPTEVELLLGDPSKAKKELGWKPEVTFEKLVEIMTRADWDALQKNPDCFND